MKSNLPLYALAVVVLVALSIPLFFVLQPGEAPVAEAPSGLGTEPARPSREASVASSAPSNEPAAVDPLSEPTSAARVHGALATELRRVAVYCPVPEGAEVGVATGGDLPWIDERGWYSALMDELQGEAVVMVREPGAPKSEAAPSFRVEWSAEDWGEQVRCEGKPVDFGSIELRVVDDSGAPVHDVFVSACSDSGVALDGTLTLTRAVAMEACELMALRSSSPPCMAGQTITGPAPGETVSHTLTISCPDPDSLDRHETMRAGLDTLRSKAPSKPSFAEQLAVAERLRAPLPASAEGAKLLDDWRDELNRKADLKELFEILDEPDLTSEDHGAVIDEITEKTMRSEERTPNP